MYWPRNGITLASSACCWQKWLKIQFGDSNYLVYINQKPLDLAKIQHYNSNEIKLENEENPQSGIPERINKLSQYSKKKLTDYLKELKRNSKI